MNTPGRSVDQMEAPAGSDPVTTHSECVRVLSRRATDPGDSPIFANLTFGFERRTDEGQ